MLWAKESLLVHVTVWPALTVTGSGEKAKSTMVAATACPAGAVVVVAAALSSPLEIAAVSAATETAAVTRATGRKAALGNDATTSVRHRGRPGWAAIADLAVRGACGLCCYRSRAREATE